MDDTSDERRERGMDRLDGNVAAGLLAELFRCEPSRATFICAGCGETAPVGTLMAYGMEMGAILRCGICDTAVLRVAAARGTYWLDVRGAVSLRLEVS